MNPAVEKQVADELDRHHAAIDKIANAVVKVAVDAFRKKFPKRRIRIMFGNGDEAIKVDGDWMRFCWNPTTRSVVWEPGTCEGKIIPSSWSVEWRKCKVYPESVEMICVMLDDLMEVTDGYRRGCPNDVN